ncbi:MAG: hypothetical protein KAJ55_00115 [Anaerolineales bacterium]|nr:hypothetical protein [Anaerolineales bacterium]
MLPKLTDKVYLGERKTPLRVAKIGKLRGEKAVALIRQSDYTEYNRRGIGAVEIIRWIHVADLVKDIGRRGWRERWRQTEMELKLKDEQLNLT